MIESTAIRVPQKAAAGTPATAKASPAREPWRIPMTREPLMVARVTETNFSTMRNSSSVWRGT